ncbi:hypothetical protein ASE04_05490 [Rhizobium sp. Root708]|nr:hypothetical protein ASE04_05490 [Rhizobium sp. Root708]
MAALGIIGAIVPLMPTTIFLILAAWFFARSSPRFEAYLLNHRWCGPPLRAWRENGAIPLKAKILAVLGMSGGYIAFFLAASPGVWLALLVGILLCGCAAYVVSRPTARRSTAAESGN